MSPPAPMPIIVGVPRSGTTLLRLMLDAHPELAIPPETHFLPSLSKLCKEPGVTRELCLRAITDFPTWDDFNLTKEQLQRAFDAVADFDVRECARAFYRLYAARLGKRRWGDKSPPYGLHMPEIESLLPEARFIHIIRDGRDVALSVKGLWFAPGEDVAAIARDWVWRIQRTRELGRHCQHYLEVRYEQLVHEAARVLQQVCAFVELPYCQEMEAYFQTAAHRLKEVQTRFNADGSVLISKEERLFNQRFTTKPPDASRVFRWKRDMPSETRVCFEQTAGGLLSELGYEVSGNINSAA